MHVQADEQDPANGERAVMTGPSRIASTGAAHDGILAWRQRADLRLDIELRFTTLGIGTAHAAQSPFWESRGVVLALRPMLGRLCIAMDDLAAQGRHECLPPETYGKVLFSEANKCHPAYCELERQAEEIEKAILSYDEGG